MKYLLIAFLLISSTAFSQEKTDTVWVILFVCDTTLLQHSAREVWVDWGYSVRQFVPEHEYVSDGGFSRGIMPDMWYHDHYLSKFKQRFPKQVIVKQW